MQRWMIWCFASVHLNRTLTGDGTVDLCAGGIFESLWLKGEERRK